MRVQLDRELVDAAPGGRVSVNVTVVNDGAHVVTPVLAVSGVDPEAVDGATQLPPLTAGVSWTTELSIALPADAPAGSRRLAVVASDRQRPDAGASAHLTVRTGSAAAVSMHVSPREIRGRMGSRFKVHVHNQGTGTVELGLRGEGDGLQIRIRPSTITLPPGTHVRVRARARTRKPAVFRTRRRPFLVTAQGTTTPVSESGAFEQHTVLGGSLVRTLGIVLVVALWAGGAFAMVKRLNGSATDAAGAPTTTTIAAPSEDADGTSGGGEAGAGGDGQATTDSTAAGELAREGEAAAGAGGTGDASGATGGTTAETVGTSGVVTGTVAGPSPLGGIVITIEPVSLGDEGASKGGKLVNTAGTRLDSPVDAQKTTTDDNGRFRFSSGLPMPGLYRVTAARVGYDVSSVVVELTADDPTVELSLTLKAATGALSGLVTDAAGQPLGGATVTVTGRSVSYTTTAGSSGDAKGTWRLDGVATPGTYLVAVTSDGFASASTVVTLAGGEQRSDIGLTMVAGVGTIHGKVSSNGVAVGGLTVSVQAVGGDTARSTTTLTQQDLLGTFELPALPLGRYTLTVAGDGWLTSTNQVVLDSGELVVNLSDLRSSTATVQGTVLLESLTAEPCRYPDVGFDPTTVSPQRCGNVGVTVANSAGTWRTTTASLTGEFRLSGIPSGSYTVTFERFGYRTATLAATLVAGTTTDIGPDGPTGKLPVVLRLTVTSGQGVANVQAVIRDVSAPTQILHAECLVTRVTVTDGGDGNGTPLLDAVAMPDQCPSQVLHAPTPTPSAYVLPCAGDARTELRACWLSDGGIRISGLTAGAKTFRFGAQGYDDALRVVQVPAGGTTELGVVQLPPLATLDGLVMGPGDTPLAGARVMAVPADAGHTIPPEPAAPEGGWHACSYTMPNTVTPITGICVDTGLSGEYEFGKALKSGSYRLIAPIGEIADWPTLDPVPLDHELRERTVTVTSGGHTTQDVSLRRYGAIYGSIQVPNGSGGFDFVTEPTITVTRASDNTVYCSYPASFSPNQLFAPPCRISVDGGQYRIDRLNALEPGDSYTVTFSKAATVNGSPVSYEAAPIVLDRGVPFNTELLRNVVMRVPRWTLKGRVVWSANGTDVPVTNQTITITGVTGYTVLPVPPFREPVIGEFTKTTSLISAVAPVDGGGNFTAPMIDINGVSSRPFVGRDVTVLVTAPGFQPKTMTVLYDGSEDQTVRVVLEPSAQTLNGVLTLAPAIGADDLADVTPTSVFSRLSVAAVSQLTGQRAVTAVNDDGTFAVSDLRPGDYDVTISGPGVDTKTTTAHLLAGDGGPPEVQVPLARHGRLRVSVTQSGGAPATGATVTLLRNGTPLMSATTCVAPTDVGGVPGCAAGTATFDDIVGDKDLANGGWDFTVRVRKTGWKDVADQTVSLATVRSAAVSFTGLVQFGWIEGKVVARNSVDDPSAPVSGARVVIADAGGTDLFSTTTDRDGSFVAVGDLAAGTYKVRAELTGYGTTTPVDAVVADGQKTTITPDIELTASLVTLKGKVVDENNAGLAGVTVKVVDTATSYQTTTSAVAGHVGEYTVQVPVGLHTVDYTATDGRDKVTRVVTLAPNSIRTLDVLMPGPTGTVFGIVFGADVNGVTAPLADADVEWSVVPASGGTATWSTVVKTDSAGVFTLTKVAANVSVQVRVSKTAYDPDPTDVTGYQLVQLTNAGSKSLTFTLVAKARAVTFTVKGRGAAVLAGVDVTATSGSNTETGTTDSNGQIAFALKPGKWTFTTTNATTLADPHYDVSNVSQYTVTRPGNALNTPMPTTQLTPWEGITVTVNGRPNDLDATLVATGVTTATVNITVGGTARALTQIGTTNQYQLRYPFGASTGSVVASAATYDTSSPKSVTITSGNTATTTVDLYESAATVTMKVVSSQGTNNLGNVSVKVSLGTFNQTQLTNSSGVATFSLRPGTNYTYITTGAASATIAGAGTVPHTNVSSATTFAAPTGATITLNPVAGTVTGTVSSSFTGGSTVALAGAQVTATLGTPTALSVGPATSGATGAYTLNLYQGTGWSVSSALTHYTTATGTVTVSAASPSPTLNLVMPRDAARIVGTVANDGGTGVDGVVVTLRRHGNATVLDTQTTAGGGTYAFAGLDPFETFDVTFDGTGVTGNDQRQAVTVVFSPQNPGVDATLDHTLSAEANSLTVAVYGALVGQNTVDYEITQPSGTLTNTTAGVIDPVTLTFTQDATTKRWSAVVPGLPASTTYQISITATGYLSAAGTAGPFVQSNIAVSAATPGTASVVVYPPARGTVNVTVKKADTTALASTALQLTGGGLVSAVSATTDATGKAVFSNVPVAISPGTGYTVVVPDGTNLVGGNLGPFYVASGASALNQSFTLERLTASVLVPPDVNSAAAATSTATVTASPAGSVTPVHTFKAPTAPATTFVLDGVLSGGTWDVTAAKTGYVTGSTTAVAAPADTTTAAPNITLALATVNVTVTVSSTDTNVTTMTNGTITAKPTGGLVPDKTFTFASNGDAVVMALEKGAWTLQYAADDHVSASTSYTVTGTASITQSLVHPQTVVLTVTSTPLTSTTTFTNLAVTVTTAPAGATAGTPTYGADTVTMTLVPGTWTMTVSADDHYQKSVTFTVKNVQTAPDQPTVALTDHESLTVRVVDGTGTLIPGATVTAVYSGGSTTAYTMVPDGTGVSVGRGAIWASLPGNKKVKATASAAGFTDNTATVTYAAQGDQLTATITLSP